MGKPTHRLAAPGYCPMSVGEGLTDLGLRQGISNLTGNISSNQRVCETQMLGLPHPPTTQPWSFMRAGPCPRF